MPILWQSQCHCCSVAIMKESTMKYARRAWTMSCEDVEYDRCLLKCYEECQLPKKEGQKWHEWQCQFCCKVVKCILRLDLHCVTGYPVVGILKMYPVVHKTNEMQWNMLSLRRVSWTLNRNLNLKFQSIKNDTDKCLTRPPKQTFYSTISFNTRSCKNQLHPVQDPQRVGCSK